jgi:hypothetical protein
MSRPAILLDVDGPLNPFLAKATRRPDGYTTHRLRPKGWEHAPKPLRVWLHPGHGALLLDLAASTGAELAWATTWEHDANTMIGPVIGLPELDVVTFDGHVKLGSELPPLTSWKIPGIEAWAAGRPLCWLDDDIGKGDIEWASARTAAGSPTLVVHVDPAKGIQPLHLAAVWGFLSQSGGHPGRAPLPPLAW